MTDGHALDNESVWHKDWSYNTRVTRKTWATTWQNQRSDCAPSEGSDQPGHPPSLIRIFAVRMKKAWVLSYPLSAQRRLWSDWADAKADLSLRWAHTHFVGFVMSRLTCGLWPFKDMCTATQRFRRCGSSSDGSSTSIYCVRALEILRGYTGSPEPSLFAYVLSSIFSWVTMTYMPWSSDFATSVSWHTLV